MKTVEQAIEQGIKGNWSRSYELALQDEGLVNTPTLFEWQQFVSKAAKERKIRNSPMPEAYYS